MHVIKRKLLNAPNPQIKERRWHLLMITILELAEHFISSAGSNICGCVNHPTVYA